MIIEEARDIIIEQYSDLQFYYAENDCYPKNYDDDFVNALEVVIGIFKELEQYRSIGTVEECREAVERHGAKKPVKYGGTRQGLDNDGNSISKQEDCYECPNCESFLGYVIDCRDENYQDCYCRNCGQHILWEESEGEDD